MLSGEEECPRFPYLERQIQEATATFLATAIELGIGMSGGSISFTGEVENAIDRAAPPVGNW